MRVIFILVLGLFLTYPSHSFQTDQTTASSEQKKEELEEIKVVEIKRVGRWYMGRVVDSKGNSLEGALVTVKGTKGAPPMPSVSRRDGSFHVNAPPNDTYTITVKMTKYKTYQSKLE